jgi:hypothetical protein
MPDVNFINIVDTAHTGEQVRGFGFLHDGSIDTVFHFLHATVFGLDDTERQNLEQFIFAYDSDFAPIVGQQVTLTSSNAATVDARIDLLIARATTNFTLFGTANAKECDLVVKGTVGGEQRGYLLNASTGKFLTDRFEEAALDDSELRAFATPGQELTYTCVPPGSGTRMGLDRDQDTFFDADEVDAGTDPADPDSFPGAPVDVEVGAKKLIIKNQLPDDEAKNKIILVDKDAAVTIPEPDGPDDPRCGLASPDTVKATLTIASTTSGQTHIADLPCGNWKLLGSPTNPKGYKYRDKEVDDGTAKIVVWKPGKLLKAILQGGGPSNLNYDLQSGVSQATVTAVLQSGGLSICSACTPSVDSDGSDGKRFLGRDCAAPVACP